MPWLPTFKNSGNEEAGRSSDRPEGTTSLVEVARKGDLRKNVRTSDLCRVGETVLLGNQEARTVVGSLVFRFPLGLMVQAVSLHEP